MKTDLSRRGVLAGAGAGIGAGLGLARAQPAGTGAGAALARLLAETPVEASGANTFVDPLSDAHGAQRLRAARSAAARLAAIDRARLTPIDQLAYDVLAYQSGETIGEFESGVFAIQQATPLDPSFGPQVSFPDEASSSAGLATVDDYEEGLRRLVAFAGYMTVTVERLKRGVAQGYLQPKVLVRNVLAEVDVMLALAPEETPFYRPLQAMPQGVAPPDQARLREAYLQVIRSQVLPGYDLWKRYLGETYLPLAREAPGLCAMKDGAKVYAAALRRHTTTDMTAEEIHRLGLAEVARIRGELEAVSVTLAYPGDLPGLFAHVRSDRSLYYSRPEDLLARFKAIEARIWQGIPRLFDRRPTAPFEVRPLPALGEARGTGYYQLGKPDGRSPGVLYFNMAMLSTRPIPTLETLTLHEGIPGHHFQGSLAQENTALPDILRFGQDRFTAYAEGWGLYAESLGKALGMFTDPWQWFGHLDFEMLRAVRLVVDTGMHAKGWSRDQAIAFMTDNTSMAAKDIAVEIDRYISAPGQATAYKVGELKILALRSRAQGSLGTRFDIRRYHDQVLMTGALPLRVLEAKIDGWIAAGGPA
jgi:uncharacterized protein (DUF885 family)